MQCIYVPTFTTALVPAPPAAEGIKHTKLVFWAWSGAAGVVLMSEKGVYSDPYFSASGDARFRDGESSENSERCVLADYSDCTSVQSISILRHSCRSMLILFVH